MINTDRGEVPITLEGTEYGLRPTYEAIVAIEEATGLSIMQLAMASAQQALRLKQIAVIVTECIKAWGAAQVPPRTDTPHFAADRVAELIHNEGLLKATPRVDLVLTHALTGGHSPGEARAAAPTMTTAETPQSQDAAV